MKGISINIFFGQAKRHLQKPVALKEKKENYRYKVLIGIQYISERGQSKQVHMFLNFKTNKPN